MYIIYGLFMSAINVWIEMQYVVYQIMVIQYISDESSDDLLIYLGE